VSLDYRAAEVIDAPPPGRLTPFVDPGKRAARSDAARPHEAEAMADRRRLACLP